MRDDIWVVGEERVTSDDIKTTRFNKKKRLKKRRIKRATDELMLDRKGDENLNEEVVLDVPSWNRFMIDVCPDFYA